MRRLAAGARLLLLLVRASARAEAKLQLLPTSDAHTRPLSSPRDCRPQVGAACAEEAQQWPKQGGAASSVAIPGTGTRRAFELREQAAAWPGREQAQGATEELHTGGGAANKTIARNETRELKAPASPLPPCTPPRQPRRCPSLGPEVSTPPHGRLSRTRQAQAADPPSRPSPSRPSPVELPPIATDVAPDAGEGAEEAQQHV